MLSADELQISIVMSNYNLPIDFLVFKTEMAHLRTRGLFLQRTSTKIHLEVMFLLFMGGFTAALMKQNNHFHLFDSQSRDERGLSIVGGTSVLLKFLDLKQVEKNIQVFYLEYRSLEQSCFQLQCMHVNKDIIELGHFMLSSNFKKKTEL